MAHDEAGRWIGYGPGDISPECEKIDRRLALAYPQRSHAREHGVVVDQVFDQRTADALVDLVEFMNSDQRERERLLKLGVKLPMRTDGIADLNVRRGIGAYVDPPKVAPRQKYPCQGVWADSRAFLNPPDAHSFEKATDDFAREGLRLYGMTVGQPIWVLGYSMGGTSTQKFLSRLHPDWRQFVVGVTTFGDPAMPAEGSLLGNDPGEGISKQPQPEWVRDRYWSYSIDGDWYPRARGLLFLLYKILTRAELSLDFAMYLFTEFPTQAMQELMGIEPPSSDDPIDRALNGVLRPLAGLLTSGPLGAIGSLLNPLAMLSVLPDLVSLLFDAIKFIATNAHGKYADPAVRLWDGMTAVDHAATTIRRVAPQGCTLYLFPGTWSNWNQLFQFDVWVRLSGDVI
ncbi:lysin B [Mycobacterium phage Thonko]|uniref:Lysin B n=1 Tax=Mycobacterium phage Thonko TaxID=2282910 RepID=A0A346FC94_9CAUD|nr:lysin B [Mycobacterium phage Thonko]AXN53319.1 lysin B [Mycobacterium phage Thonko]